MFLFRLIASGIAVLLLASPHSAQTPDLSIGLDAGAEYPPQDLAIWGLMRPALLRQQAAAEPSPAADSTDAVRLYAASDTTRMLDSLRLIVDTRPDRLASALDALSDPFLLRFGGNDEAALQNTERMRQIIAAARARLPELPREDAARAARQLLALDVMLIRGDRQRVWIDGLEQFVEEYRGSEAALLADVDLIGSGRISQEMFDRLQAFAERHPGTTAAARALYLQGFHWHTINTIGTVEPRAADPAPRLLRVVAIVSELESGRYPPSEWVDKAPSLIVGFFMPRDVAIPPASIDAMLAAYEAFVRTRFELDPEHPADSGVGYVIRAKMGDLFERKGDRLGGVERVLDDLERSAPDPAAVRYLRALVLMHAARDTPRDREVLTARLRESLIALADAGSALYHRRALATLAAMEFALENWSAARDAYRRYANAYPQSGWSWVAALRIGQCEERLGDPQAAAAAYLAAADRHADLPVARVLGHAYAARAYETAGAFDRALASHERALAQWDDTFGLRYSTYVRRALAPGDGFILPMDVAEVAKESLAPRIAQLRTSLASPGGERLERGRALLAGGQYVDAAAELQRMIAEHPDSTLVADARTLIHRSRLERALQLAEVDGAAPDPAAALRELEALAGEPLDVAVVAARIARASLLWTRRQPADAQAIMREALTAWHAQQEIAAPASALEEDVAGIRRAVFLPRGGSIYEGRRWNAFDWPRAEVPFLLVNPELRASVSPWLRGHVGRAGPQENAGVTDERSATGRASRDA